MCIFSRPVPEVADTRVFARLGSDNRQLLAYEMRYRTEVPVAMVLPLPVLPNSGEDAVRFYNLQEYATLFDDLALLFDEGVSGAPGGFSGGSARTLTVQNVGDFVASYVPTLADFVRLDPRFRLPKTAFTALPHYAEWGFAVFQLRQTARVGVRVHPMALSFRVNEGGKLFFPTVHIHDGTVHATERFDHVLYAQWDGPTGGTLQRIFSPSPWQKTKQDIGQVVKVARTQGIVEARLPVHRRELRGRFPNRDTWLSPADLT